MAEDKLSKVEFEVFLALGNIDSDEDYKGWVTYAEHEGVNVNKIANIALEKFALTQNFDIVKILINNETNVKADVNIKVTLDHEEMPLLEWFITILQKETLDKTDNLEQLMCKTVFNEGKIRNLLEIINSILHKNRTLSAFGRIILKGIFDKCEGNTAISPLLLSFNSRINPYINPDKKEGGKRKSRKQRKSRKSRNQKKQLRSRRFKRQTR